VRYLDSNRVDGSAKKQDATQQPEEQPPLLSFRGHPAALSTRQGMSSQPRRLVKRSSAQFGRSREYQI